VSKDHNVQGHQALHANKADIRWQWNEIVHTKRRKCIIVKYSIEDKSVSLHKKWERNFEQCSTNNTRLSWVLTQCQPTWWLRKIVA